MKCGSGFQPRIIYFDNIMIREIPTAGIILAAGESTRFGRPKQLLRLNNRCLIEWVLAAALHSKLSRIVLVLGYAHQEILQTIGEKLQHSKLSIEINPEFKKGQSHSLRAGLSKVKDDYPAVMFLLGDQPMLNSATINILLERFWASDRDVCVPIYQGKRKTPTIFGRRFYTRLMKIKGDVGARQLIDDHPDRVLAVEMENPVCFFDIDTQQDFSNFKKRLEQEAKGQ
jgi:molybdenum cofactor cytidylyltransferase